MACEGNVSRGNFRLAGCVHRRSATIGESRGENMNPLSRREVLSRLGGGFGGLVLASMLEPASADAPRSHDLRPKPPHFPAKAQAVIQLFMHGGPSHLDLLDPK